MYNYETEKPKVFLEENQKMFLGIHEKAKELISVAGAARCDKIIAEQSGDSWTMLACVDRLVEIGEIKEVPQITCRSQDRLFREAGQ